MLRLHVVRHTVIYVHIQSPLTFLSQVSFHSSTITKNEMKPLTEECTRLPICRPSRLGQLDVDLTPGMSALVDISSGPHITQVKSKYLKSLSSVPILWDCAMQLAQSSPRSTRCSTSWSHNGFSGTPVKLGALPGESETADFVLSIEESKPAQDIIASSASPVESFTRRFQGGLFETTIGLGGAEDNYRTQEGLHASVLSPRAMRESQDGIDHQGIPWARFSMQRVDCRLRRSSEVTNYNNVQWTEQLEHQRRCSVSSPRAISVASASPRCLSASGSSGTETPLFGFHKSYRSASPTIDHFQLRHLVKYDSTAVNEAGVYFSMNSAACKFDKPSNRVTRVHAQHPHQLACIDVRNDLVVSGGFDSTVKLSRSSANEEVIFSKVLSTVENCISNHVGFSGQQSLIVGNNDGVVRFLDLSTGVVNATHDMKNAINSLCSVDFDESNSFAIACDSTEIRIVDLRVPDKNVRNLKGHLDYVFSVACHGNLLYSGGQDGTCRIWDLRASDSNDGLSSSSSVSKDQLTCLGCISGAARSVRVSKSGRFVAFGEPTDFVHVYDVLSGFEKCQVIDFFGVISGFDFAPCSELLTIGVADAMFGCLVDYVPLLL